MYYLSRIYLQPAKNIGTEYRYFCFCSSLGNRRNSCTSHTFSAVFLLKERSTAAFPYSYVCLSKTLQVASRSPFFVLCKVFYPRFCQGLSALTTRSATPAMLVASLVTAPRFGKIHPELLPSAGDIRLGYAGIRGKNTHLFIGSGGGGSRHRCHKIGTTVGIDGMVAAMIGHHYIFQTVALGHADGYGKHNTIAERHHCRLHVPLVVTAFGDSVCTF